MLPETLPSLPVPPGIVGILIGCLLILAGRKLFWLALGAAAFSAGAFLSTHLPIQLKPEGQLLLALICGLVGILLASFIRRTGVAVGGFLIGALFGLYVAQAYSPGEIGTMVISAGIGALVGWALARKLVDIALTILSSVMGAMLVVENAPVAQPWAGAALLALTLMGIVVQSRRGKRRR